MTALYLSFVDYENLLAYLKTKGTTSVHAEISTLVGDRDSTHDVAGVSFIAALSALVPGATGTAYPLEHLACSSMLLLETNTVHLSLPDSSPATQERREKLHGNFDRVCQDIKQAGFEVLRGQWLYEAPEYMR
ncbi:MAG: hypothetical protein AAFQ89_15480 [Cyanobacteria bacterium J06626_18]